MSETISMHLTQVALYKGIPFEVGIPEIPNGLTAATIRKSEEGKELNEVGSVDELSEELDKRESFTPTNSRRIQKGPENSYSSSRNNSNKYECAAPRCI